MEYECRAAVVASFRVGKKPAEVIAWFGFKRTMIMDIWSKWKACENKDEFTAGWMALNVRSSAFITDEFVAAIEETVNDEGSQSYTKIATDMECRKSTIGKSRRKLITNASTEARKVNAAALLSELKHGSAELLSVASPSSMKRAEVVVHKLADAEVKRLCCSHDSIDHKVAVDNMVHVNIPDSENPPTTKMVKDEVPDDELVDITVKEEPIDWHQEPQTVDDLDRDIESLQMLLQAKFREQSLKKAGAASPGSAAGTAETCSHAGGALATSGDVASAVCSESLALQNDTDHALTIYSSHYYPPINFRESFFMGKHSEAVPCMQSSIFGKNHERSPIIQPDSNSSILAPSHEMITTLTESSGQKTGTESDNSFEVCAIAGPSTETSVELPSVTSHSLKRVTCPVCHKSVTSISKHMMTKQPGHGWPRAKAKHAARILGLQKTKKRKETTYVRKLKKCPVKNCFSLAARLDVHMKLYHPNLLQTKVFYKKETAMVIDHFKAWVMTSDGGCRASRTSARQGEQIHRLATMLKVASSVDVFDDEVKLVELLTNLNISKKWSCKTVKSYLFSLESFGHFLRSRTFAEYYNNHSKDFSKNLESILSNYANVSESISRWATAFTEKGKVGEHKQCEQERQSLITAEQARACIYGKLFKKVRKLQKLLHDNQISSEGLTSYHYYLVRDYLILNIFLSNAHRYAAVAELTVHGYKNSQLREGKTIIDIKKDKALGTYCSPFLVLRPRLAHLMKFFFVKIRPLFALDNSEHFFVTRNGTKLSTGQVNSAVRSAWVKSGMPRDQKITPNLEQKSTTTRVFIQAPNGYSAATALMMHSDKTDALLYGCVDSEKKAMVGHSTTSSVNGLQENCNFSEREDDGSEYDNDPEFAINLEASDVEQQLTGNDEPSNLQNSLDDYSQESTVAELPMTEPELLNPPFVDVNKKRLRLEESNAKQQQSLDVLTDGSDREDLGTDEKKFKVFSIIDDQKIKVLFHDLISRRNSVTKPIVQERLQNKQPFLLRKYTFTQILDKIRYLKKNFKK